MAIAKIKIWLPILILLLSITFLVGCGQKVDSNTNQTSQFKFVIPLKPGPNASVEKNTDGPVFGNTVDPKLTVVMFVDFECPYCQEAFSVIRPVMLKYKNQVKFVFRDFPLTSIHPDALTAANGGRCTLESGKFWEWHDRVFQEKKLDTQSLIGYASQVGIDSVTFSSCLQGHKYQDKIQNDVALGQSIGVTGTPTYVVNGYSIPGVIPFDGWVRMIDEYLGRSK